MFIRSTVLVISLLVIGSNAVAHEFWIRPDSYIVDRDAQITARFFVGQNMKGAEQSFIRGRSMRSEIVFEERSIPVSSRNGDKPAMSEAAQKDGLAILIHETTDSDLIYRKWVKFQKFVTHKGFGGVEAAHIQRGVPITGFKESYRRYAKSLVSVGDGAGQDRAVGLDIELVALNNPYLDDVRSGLSVLALYRGVAKAGAQLEIFAKAPDGNVEVSILHADADGVSNVSVQPGFEYLIDTVAMEPVRFDDPLRDAVWHSLWASLTFMVPAP